MILKNYKLLLSLSFALSCQSLRLDEHLITVSSWLLLPLAVTHRNCSVERDMSSQHYALWTQSYLLSS